MITYTANKSANLPILFHTLKIQELPKNQQIAIAQIDEVLPQTQCGLCTHQDGCLPFRHSTKSWHNARQTTCHVG